MASGLLRVSSGAWSIAMAALLTLSYCPDLADAAERTPDDSRIIHPPTIDISDDTFAVKPRVAFHGKTPEGAPPFVPTGAAITGLTTFVANRAQGEVSAWFVERVLGRICGPNVSPYAPATCSLQVILERSAFPTSAAVASAVRSDLRRLPAQIVSELDGASWAAVLVRLIEKLQSGGHIGDYIAGLADHAALRLDQDSGSVAACALIAAAFAMDVNKSESHEKQVQALRTRLDTLRGETASLNPDSLLAEDLLSAVEELSDAIPDKTQSLFDPEPARSRRVVALAIKNLLVTASRISQTPGDVTVFRLSVSVVCSVLAGDYSEALLPAFALMDQRGTALPNVQKRVASGRETVTRYLPLFVELADAEEPQDVKAILDRVAVPAGGWRIKREAKGPVVTLGALVGASAGAEYLKDAPSPLEKGKRILGLFAPIGIDFSMATASGWTMGLFASILDVGNLMSVRVADNREAGLEISSAPNDGLAQIVSPGAYVRFGIGRSPFVTGVGGSFTPEIRRSKDPATGDTNDHDAWRVSIFVAADVPILGL